MLFFVTRKSTEEAARRQLQNGEVSTVGRTFPEQ